MLKESRYFLVQDLVTALPLANGHGNITSHFGESSVSSFAPHWLCGCCSAHARARPLAAAPAPARPGPAGPRSAGGVPLPMRTVHCLDVVSHVVLSLTSTHSWLSRCIFGVTITLMYSFEHNSVYLAISLLEIYYFISERFYFAFYLKVIHLLN